MVKMEKCNTKEEREAPARSETSLSFEMCVGYFPTHNFFIIYASENGFGGDSELAARAVCENSKGLSENGVDFNTNLW